jgi:hypothetical protein
MLHGHLRQHRAGLHDLHFPQAGLAKRHVIGARIGRRQHRKQRGPQAKQDKPKQNKPLLHASALP